MNEETKLKLLLEFMDYVFTTNGTTDLLKRTAEFFVQTFKLANCFLKMNDHSLRYYSHPDLEKKYLRVEAITELIVKDLKTSINILSLQNDDLTRQVKEISDIPQTNLVIPLVHDRVYLGTISLYSENSLKEHAEVINVLSNRFLKTYLLLKKQDVLHRDSITDPLTGLFNRKYMNAHLSKTLDRSKSDKTPNSLIIFDIDDFKKFNDNKGHLEGDQLLKKISNIVVQIFRHEDVVCRYGGEEFVIILKDADRDISLKRAENLRVKVLEETGESISVGLMTCKNSSLSAQEMLKHADDALYKAKRTGKNRVVSFITLDKSLGVVDTEHATS
ncbi:hypothetical protein COV11_00560 [Candidatus Woesearchaeota archaeon CG10_big_fil_rev_8_21_14_0_10_30_7]|nr:MAG: hypothetical protein COV11_00560 [Candidatus Woesearchaeota archaeon CG10_big_fil_rev_8_21_14_0_10_30_7]